MYVIVIEQKFFCNGYAFPQVIGVEETEEQAKERLEILKKDDVKLNQHSVVIKPSFVITKDVCMRELTQYKIRELIKNELEILCKKCADKGLPLDQVEAAARRVVSYCEEHNAMHQE